MVMMVRYLLSFYLSAWLLALSDGQIEFSGDDRKAGLIILHGLGVSMGPDVLCEAFARSRFGLGLSENTIVRCPAAARKPVGVIPATFVPGLNFARSWFDFFMMPALSVMSSTGGENKDDLCVWDKDCRPGFKAGWSSLEVTLYVHSSIYLHGYTGLQVRGRYLIFCQCYQASGLLL